MDNLYILRQICLLFSMLLDILSQVNIIQENQGIETL